jgi:hypothetical protein
VTPRPRIVLALAAGLAVLAAAAALGARAWLLRDTTTPIDVARVVERASASPGARVYAYDTRGFEEATALGAQRHDYPATTTLTVAAEGCGTSLRWEALDRRSERWLICDGAPVRLDDVHAFFGRTDERSYRCSADPAGFRCAIDGTERTDRVEDLGRVRVEIAGETVPARRLRLRTTMRGDTAGTGTIDLWLALDAPLPLRVVAANRSTTGTPIGTDADYRERFELRLRSLEPVSR